MVVALDEPGDGGVPQMTAHLTTQCAVSVADAWDSVVRGN